MGGRRFMGPDEGTTGYRREDGSELSGHFFGQSSFATHSLAYAHTLVKIPRDIPLELAGVLACGITTGAGAIPPGTAPPTPSTPATRTRSRGSWRSAAGRQTMCWTAPAA